MRDGSQSELIVSAKLCSLGYQVSIPFGHDCPYDLVVESDGQFLAVQVKTAVRKNNTENSIKASTKKGNGGKYSDDEVDVFVIYWPGGDDVFLVGLDECEKSVTLSLKDEKDIEPRHAHKTRIADEYSLERRNLSEFI